MTDEMNKEVFWTKKVLLVVHIALLVLIGLGFLLRGYTFLTGSFAGLSVSVVFLWYLVISIIWWIVLSTFFVQKVMEKRSDRLPFSSITVLGMYIISLLPAWILFIFNMYLYVRVNQLIF